MSKTNFLQSFPLEPSDPICFLVEVQSLFCSSALNITEDKSIQMNAIPLPVFHCKIWRTPVFARSSICGIHTPTSLCTLRIIERFGLEDPQGPHRQGHLPPDWAAHSPIQPSPEPQLQGKASRKASSTSNWSYSMRFSESTNEDWWPYPGKVTTPGV